MDFIVTLMLILFTSRFLGWLAVKVGQPAVIGELLSGLLIGPAVLNWVHLTPTLHNLSSLGVIMLMFIAGLHSDIGLLKRYLKSSLVIAVLGILLPIVTITGLGLGMGWNLNDATFLGLIFAATSVSITVAVLQEMRKLRSKEGSTILGAAVADDILTVILLGVVVTFSGTKLGNQITANLSIGWIILIQLIYLVLVYFLAIKVIIPVMERLNDKMTTLTLATVALLICLCLAQGAEMVGLSAITGSFFAGLAINPTVAKKRVSPAFNSLGELFLIPIFFASVGLEMDWQGFVDEPVFLIALIILALMGKLIGAGGGAKLMHFSWSSSFMIGSGMISRGEVGLIIAQLVYQQHLLNSEQYSTIVAALIITTIIAPLILKKSIRGKKSPNDLRI